MLAYVFWHTPLANVAHHDYETALVNFHADLGRSPPAGVKSSATYRVSGLPWLNRQPCYEDWCFITSSAVLEPLNQAAVAPERWDAHAGVASKTDFGHGGLYYHLHGDQRTAGTRVVWLKRPRGIRYEKPLQDMIDRSTGFVSCWRKLMVLGPGHEFAIVGGSALEVPLLDGWEALVVNRRLLGPEPSSVGADLHAKVG